MKSKHLLMALLSGGLTFGSCTSTPHVPEGSYSTDPYHGEVRVPIDDSVCLYLFEQFPIAFI